MEIRQRLLKVRINTSTLILLGVGGAIVGASLFMISEAGAFFATWYPGAAYKGYWAAALSEAFLAMAAAAHFQGRKWLNRVLKTVMAILFISVVVGASFNLVVPMTKEYAKAQRQAELVSFLKTEHQQNQASLKAVAGQRINTVLAINQQRESNQEYKKELRKETDSPWAILIVMSFTLFMRVSVQTANLVFAYGFGILWRGEKRKQQVIKKAATGTAKTVMARPHKLTAIG